MDEFLIPVIYKGKEIGFHSKSILFGYSYKIQVDVFGENILFEPDEEQKYRAVMSEDQRTKDLKFEAQLLNAIAEVLNQAMGRET